LGNAADLKLVHTHPSNIVVAQARNALERAGIKCALRNEYAAGAMGELAPIDVWAQLWILRDRDYERAMLLLAQSVAEIDEADWHCKRCGSESPATFDLCWHCAGDRTTV
jgi:hypothetical protein